MLFRSNRAWVTSKRNPYWKNVVIKHGYVVKILEDGLTEEQAYEKEKQLIAEVGLENLTNLVEGGKGFTSEEATQNMQKLLQDPEWRRKNKEHREKIYQDPEWRKRNAEKNRKLAQDPEWRKKQREGAKRRSQDPEWKRNHDRECRRITQDPEYRKKQKEGAIKQAQDPEFRKKQLDGIKRYLEQKRLMKS